MPRTTPTWSDAATSTLPRLAVDGKATDLPVWTARSRGERRTGLLGTDGIDGAVWITRCNWVHCCGMRYPLDVVYVARCGEVLAVAPLAPGRVGLPRPRAAAVVEMARGEAARLGVVTGAVLSSMLLVDPAGLTGPSGTIEAARCRAVAVQGR